VPYFEAMAFSESPDSAHCMESATTLPESATELFVMHPVVTSSSPIDTCAVVRACFRLLGVNELQSRLCVPSARPIGVHLEI